MIMMIILISYLDIDNYNIEVSRDFKRFQNKETELSDLDNKLWSFILITRNDS